MMGDFAESTPAFSSPASHTHYMTVCRYTALWTHVIQVCLPPYDRATEWLMHLWAILRSKIQLYIFGATGALKPLHHLSWLNTVGVG